jgi:hypothetical protein
VTGFKPFTAAVKKVYPSGKVYGYSEDDAVNTFRSGN